MKLITKGLAINYRDEGKGRAIVMIHGWGSNLATFDQLTSRLANNYRVVRLDLPGFGESELPPSDWSLKDYVDLVGQFYRKVGIEKPYTMVGHSLGGRILIKGFGSGQLKSSKVVLLAPHGIRESKSVRSLLFLLIAKIGKLATLALPLGVRKRLREKLYRAAGSTDYLESGPMRQIFSNIIKEDLQDIATKIDKPTLLVYGTGDKTTPPALAQRFASLIKNSQIELIPDAGHYVHEDEPDEVARLMREFLV